MIATKVTHNAPSSGLVKYWVARLFMTIIGWNVTGELPADKKFVLIGAPHTSNWDFFLGLSTIFIFRVKARWLANERIDYSDTRWYSGGVRRNAPAPA